ncbi:MAG: NAD(P)/FAD-dependent oxidoreductase [Halioglobus sp.]|nr:NAD(P)/FAD-dependent oxidoreductase [Halioglobus sp.]
MASEGRDAVYAEVIVVGAGFAGVGAAIKLKETGFDFLVLEKGSEIGGVWRDNVYPDCACDIPSSLYSFSFAPKPDWSHFYARQEEIRQYTLDTATRFGIEEKIRVDRELLEARWNEKAAEWSLKTQAGYYRCRFVIMACGPMHVPVTPAIPGLDTFQGDRFHSARWQKDFDFTNKRVAVIGSGASAIQFLPVIQKQVRHLSLFQRTPPWVLPKMDVHISPLWQRRFARFPFLQAMLRKLIYMQFELLNSGLNQPRFVKWLQGLATRNMRRGVSDPALQEKLIPDYTIGCKRILQSNTWYPALAAGNVSVTGGVSRIEGNCLFSEDGSRYEVDTIIFGTGFEVANPPIAERIVAADGRTLADHWGGSPQVYMGTLPERCPNLFLTFGPNLYTFSSAFVIIEAQLKLVIKTLTEVRKLGVHRVEVRPEKNKDYNTELQSALKHTVWNAGGCISYFIDRNGRNSSNWPWSTFSMRRRFSKFRLSDCDSNTVPG